MKKYNKKILIYPLKLSIYDKYGYLREMLDDIKSKRRGMTNHEILCYGCYQILLELEAGERLGNNYIIPKVVDKKVVDKKDVTNKR